MTSISVDSCFKTAHFVPLTILSCFSFLRSGKNTRGYSTPRPLEFFKFRYLPLSNSFCSHFDEKLGGTIEAGRRVSRQSWEIEVVATQFTL